MTCFRPWLAYPAAPPGKGLVYCSSKSYVGAKPVMVPCYSCVGCRMARAREWSVRMVHEAQLHQDNSFLTLTFSDANLPPDYSVDIRDVQLFMKRLRKAIGCRVRFFAAGEYGDKDLRPHYHVVLFGYGFVSDRQLWRTSSTGYSCYRSETLERCWPFGFSEIGTMTKQSAAYVARYVVKKIGGEAAADHYRRVHPLSGELVTVRPEFATMSRKPGLGGDWWDRFRSDCFPSDFLVVDGEKVPVPQFYTKRLKKEDAASDALATQYLAVRAGRAVSARERASDATPERLAVREELQELRLKQLKRSL